MFPETAFRWRRGSSPEGSAAGAKFMAAAGPPSGQILRGAQEHFAELIVIGTQGPTERDRLIMGWTVKRVVLAAPCPVVAIRAAAEAL